MKVGGREEGQAKGRKGKDEDGRGERRKKVEGGGEEWRRRMGRRMKGRERKREGKRKIDEEKLTPWGGGKDSMCEAQEKEKRSCKNKNSIRGGRYLVSNFGSLYGARFSVPYSFVSALKLFDPSSLICGPVVVK